MFAEKSGKILKNITSITKTEIIKKLKLQIEV